MRNLINAAIFFILAQFCHSSFAADISIRSDSHLLFLLSGEIKSGDAEKLAKSIILQANSFAGFSASDAALFLDSSGGSVGEALRIASLVKALHMITFVPSGGICASACFFVFLAGDSRVANGTVNGSMADQSMGYIGLHRPYFKHEPTTKNGSVDAEVRQHDMMQIASAYLRNQDVPQRLIDLMMSRPSNDIYWMTHEDVKQLGKYSPGREEWLISHCGYSRNTVFEDELFSEDSAVREQAFARHTEKVEAFVECSRESSPDLIEESVTNTDRLRKGWRPWLNQKLRKKRK